jgi:hypothetical protein
MKKHFLKIPAKPGFFICRLFVPFPGFQTNRRINFNPEHFTALKSTLKNWYDFNADL